MACKISALNHVHLDEYLIKLKMDKPNLVQNSDDTILELMSIVRDKKSTLAAMMSP